jgi:DNA repair protein RadD
VIGIGRLTGMLLAFGSRPRLRSRRSVGLNNDARWYEFREIDLDDQALIHDWLTAEPTEVESEQRNGGPRRFDLGVLVDHELVSHFVDEAFLDSDDDRIIDELLARPLGAELTVGDVVDRETLRERLRDRVAEMAAERPTLTSRLCHSDVAKAHESD